MDRRWIFLVVPVAAVLLVVRGSRSGRVDDDPVPRTPVAVEHASLKPPIASADEVVVAGPAVPNPQSSAVEVLDSTVPYATARAVNSWFDFESALSDLSGYRETLGEEIYRQEVIRMTAEFLDLPPERVPAFESTLRIVQAEYRKIEQEMGRELAAHPIDLSDADLQRLQSDAQDRVRPRRQASLSRFEPFLDSRDRHREFRGCLDSWITRCCGLDP